MDTKHKAKLRELKTNIALARQEMLVVNSQLLKGLKTPQEEYNEEEVKKLQTDLAQRIAIISALEEEFKLTKMNKNMSSSFEWHPAPGPNRKARRVMARQKRLL